jgi:hypothetical protein
LSELPKENEVHVEDKPHTVVDFQTSSKHLGAGVKRRMTPVPVPVFTGFEAMEN